MRSVKARNKTTPARVSLALRAMDATARVLNAHHGVCIVTHLTAATKLHRSLSACAVDTDECAALMACENAKYECKNKPGSFECLCRYQNDKDTEGCGTYTPTYRPLLRLVMGEIPAITDCKCLLFSVSRTCATFLECPFMSRELCDCRGIDK